MMDILLTLPAHFVTYFKKHARDFPSITAVYSDPAAQKLGSGGGTVHAIWQHGTVPSRFLTKEARVHSALQGNPGLINRNRPEKGNVRSILIHSDGQSRRLPAYAPLGKSLIPFPVFKWGRGQKIDQTLFDVQRPMLEKMMNRSPGGQNTMIVSGDSLVWTDCFRSEIPQADVVCIGVWAPPETASKHGVFVVSRKDPTHLEYMLQKPALARLQALSGNSMYLLDAGIWLLSDRAVAYLFQETGWDFKRNEFRNGCPGYYDLYTELGGILGSVPGKNHGLSARIIPLDHAEFYHFGSNSDLLKSARALHERVIDQRGIWHKKIKPSPDIFVQNAVTRVPFSETNSSIWIENSCIPEGWTLHDHHILSGIPQNSWRLQLPPGICLDFVPVGHHNWCIRPYGFKDNFRGMVGDASTSWLNLPMMDWFKTREFSNRETAHFRAMDIYDCPVFPVLHENKLHEGFVQWLVSPPSGTTDKGHDHFKAEWLASKRLSASDIIDQVNHVRLAEQRKKNMLGSLVSLAANRHQSVFYQLDLNDLATKFRLNRMPLPPKLPSGSDVMTEVHDLMFRSAYYVFSSPKEARNMEREAFERLKDGMIESLDCNKVHPVLEIQHDQILWGRSPVRLDLAGGWTDTPPFCLINGGSVVNMAVELNGQPPIQVYIRPIARPEIMIRSIDLGVSELIRSYDEIGSRKGAGSAFSIPKAALMLAGFYPGFSAEVHKTLADQLRAFGGGLDISLMVAVPKGSGLGTSSILAATLLGGLSTICRLGWDRHEIAYRTLLLEQLLTTGGGWQDQLGGIFEGVKLIESIPGLVQHPNISWAPDHLFTRPETKELVLLYYTGITRVAKHILTDIVKGMFLNSAAHLEILAEMKFHATHTYETVRNHDWNGLTKAIRYSWELNNRLDPGTNPPAVAAIIRAIKDHTDSYKLLGAGGGGYLLLCAKDLDAIAHIRSILGENPPNKGARFVEWGLSSTGMEITRS